MNQQTVIPLDPGGEFSLDAFIRGANDDLLVLLDRIADGSTDTEAFQLIFIWGAPGVGKTHLLHALVQRSVASNHNARYVSLGQEGALEELATESGEGALICADNLAPESTDRQSALALLGLYEGALANGSTLVIGATRPPERFAEVLPDLASRLASGTTFELIALDDAGRRKALSQRAALRGFDLDDSVVDFIMRRAERDTASLFTLLDRIDSASLSSQRRVTVPLIRELLG